MKNLFCITMLSVSFCLWICAPTATAQVQIEWDKSIGGNSHDELSSTISTADGGYLLAGSSFSDASADKSENSRGDFDYWIVKTDAQGNKQWDKTFGGGVYDFLNSIISTPDGGFMLAGSSSSNASIDKSENSKGGPDYWIVKTDAQGNKQWDRTFGGNRIDDLRSVIATPDGGYLLAGHSTSDISADKSEDNMDNKRDCEVFGICAADYWVIKIDAYGNKEWDRTFGGRGGDNLQSVSLTFDGGYILGGSSGSNASEDKSENSKGSSDYWVVKIDEQGNKIWDKTFGTSSKDELYSVISATDGGYLLAGTSFSDISGDKSENSKGGSDYWVVKIDEWGNKLWDSTFGGNGGDELSHATLTSDGGYLLGGTSWSEASADKTEGPRGINDYWVVKIGLRGEKQWDKTVGGNSLGLDYLRNVISTLDGGYLLGGHSDSRASAEKSENSKGNSDYWVIKLKGEGTTTVNPAVVSLTLLNAQTDEDIGEFREGYVINLAGEEGSQLSIRANTSPGMVDSVQFKLSGPITHQQIEKNPPYTLFGKSDGDYSGIRWIVGDYNLTVTPYTEEHIGTAITISFQVIEDAYIVPPAIEWDKTIGGDNYDYLQNVIPTFDGGYLLAGWSNSNPSGLNDYWIVKTDSQGNKLWDKTFGGNESDESSSIVPASNGGYLLAGHSFSDVSGDKSANSIGANDYWIVKIDDHGNKEWDKTLGGSDYDFFDSVVPTSDGGYLLGGYSASDASEYKSENNKGGTDYWIIKIDSLGNKQWDKTLGGNGNEELHSITPTPVGGYLLAGSSTSAASGDKSEGNLGYLDYWVVKVDDYGNKVWDKTLGGIANDFLYSAIYTLDGGYLLAGSSDSPASEDKSEDSKGMRDYWIVKIDSLGNKEWDKILGGNREDFLYSSISTHDGGYLLGGTSESDASSDKSENSNGTQDYWIVKIDSQGQKVWDKIIGGSYLDQLSEILITPNGGYLLAGHSYSDISGDKSEDNNGMYDYWIVKLKGEETPPVEASITSFTLISAENDQELQELRDGDIIHLAALDFSLLSIRANTAPSVVDSVHLKLEGPFSYQRMERKAPYALFSDQQGDFFGRKLKACKYTLTATPYLEGQAAIPLCIAFELSQAFEITRFQLIDATVDKTLCELQEGAVIDLASLQHHLLTVSAETQPHLLDKLVFTLDGPSPHTSTDRQYPYALFSEPTAADGTIDYTGGRWKTGSYTLMATPYLQGKAGTSYAISFRVKDSSYPDSEEHSLKINVYPNPTTGVITIAHEGNSEQAELRLLDCRGKLLLRQPLSPLAVQQWDLNAYKKGIYYLKVVSPAKVQVTRIVLDY